MRFHRSIALLLAAGCARDPAPPAVTPARPRTATSVAGPPVAERRPHRTRLHGIERVDDYDWISVKDTPELLAYLKAENQYTEARTASSAGLRKRLYDEMLARLKQTDESAPYRKGGFLYYDRTEAGKQYPIVCRRRDKAGAAEEVLLDLNQMRGDNAFIDLGTFEVSDDGTRLAFSTDVTGFREYTLQVKDLASGTVLDDRIAKVDSFAWAADGKTLFYVTEDHAKRPFRLARHLLGTKPADDPVVVEEKDERFTAEIERTRDGGYLLLQLESHTTSEVWLLDARTPAGKLRVVAPRRADHEYEVAHRNGTLWIRTNDKGRNFRLVTAPASAPGKPWKEVIPHRDDVMLEAVDLFRDFYVTAERVDAIPRLTVVPFRGQRWDIPVDEAVYSIEPDENHEFAPRAYRYLFESFTTPETIYQVDLASRRRTLIKRKEVLGGFDPSRYESERIAATATDGTRIPISLVRKKGALRDGSAPMLLVGYGAYGAPYDVTFDSPNISLLDRGVVYAIAHVRGGGDLGKKWHDAGRMMSKRNTFTDFIACAEHLIRERHVSPTRLAITGRSAGGLLVGAVVNMRPDLFAAALAGVPFVDVINTMLDDDLPLTVGEFEEWGNPRDKAAYDYMMTYSPYDNVEAKAYPPMLVSSSYNDSQVLYHEPAKWVARLRALKTDDHPLLLKMNLSPAGHGGKSGRYEKLEEEAFELAWILTTLAVEE